MISFDSFYAKPEFKQWKTHFSEVISNRTKRQRHGDLSNWLTELESLPDVHPSRVELSNSTITIGHSSDLTKPQAQQLASALKNLAPWRKGPFQFFDTFIDTEWRSDLKWLRVSPHIQSLQNRKVLDIGCGTGYHGWRMLGEGAAYVMGIDPSMRFLVQFNAVQKYLNHTQFDFLPIGIEDMPNDFAYFDSVFSMGVLYHRRNPIHHLLEIKQHCAPSAEVILETLIIDDTELCENGIFTPKGRYAQMRNVWNIMTVEKIVSLLDEAGFTNCRVVDVNTTSLEEQRRTDWMQFHSLAQFLNPKDHSKTIEGYPAPRRGLFIANLA